MSSDIERTLLEQSQGTILAPLAQQVVAQGFEDITIDKNAGTAILIFYLVLCLFILALILIAFPLLGRHILKLLKVENTVWYAIALVLYIVLAAKYLFIILFMLAVIIAGLSS